MFSFGLSVAGLLGEPRRTNLGLTYSNPDSPLFHPAWEPWSRLGALGGMHHDGRDAVLLRRLLRHAVQPPGAQSRGCSSRRRRRTTTKTSALVRNFTPWVVAADRPAWWSRTYRRCTRWSPARRRRYPAMTRRARSLRLHRHRISTCVFVSLLALLTRLSAGAQTLLPPDPSKTVGGSVSFEGFVDENGRDVASLLARPTGRSPARPWIVSPIYTRCPFTCSPITSALRSALEGVGLAAVRVSRGEFLV